MENTCSVISLQSQYSMSVPNYVSQKSTRMTVEFHQNDSIEDD